ncbi:MAG: tRNA sulfurtransferase [Thermoplasmatota archaeon]
MDALLLLSGGIDSPVAGHLLSEQGLQLGAIHFSLEPFTDANPEHKCRELAGILGINPLVVIPAGPIFAEIPKKTAHRLYYVLSKRLMIRIADRWASQVGARYLATGESIGQVSSQTLPHIRAIDAVAKRPTLRPLLGWDKSEIVEVAMRIGTFDVSKGPEVCDVLGPDHPSTHASMAEVEAEEARLPTEEMVRSALAGVRLVEVEKRAGPRPARVRVEAGAAPNLQGS